MTQIDTPAVQIEAPDLRTTINRTPVMRPAPRDPLALPETVDRSSISYGVVAVFIAVHVLGLAVMAPWLFSWTGLILFVAGTYLIGGMGINICYHRLLTHRSFTTPKWFERILSCLAFCNLEGSSIRWVATHRMHHQHSDHQPDPHSPLVNFLWSHMGWMVVKNSDIDDQCVLDRYAGDLARDRFHRFMHQHNQWLMVWAIHAAVIFAAGWLVGHLVAGQWIEGLRLGLSWLAWGVFLRIIVIWHVTWSINSVTHLWGSRRYRTTDDSRNNWLLGIIAFGEGWHNNHHADQRSAKAGHRWWELDISYLTIRLFGLFGLARQIIRPQRNYGTSHDLKNKVLDDASFEADERV